jgi:UDP-N-acetylglucosamine/UDP-N-acetylgalactosamine diphosphorylase
MSGECRVKKLMEKGVFMPNPSSVYIHHDVNLERISGKGVTIHAGCRLFGSETLVLEGSDLGREAPLTVENCQIGPRVKLQGGYAREAVFLEGSVMGSGAHVREGTILEEQANGAHTVGLKHTILFPFVTLGSLINFCDCLLSGGTDRNNHSEVGSSYIHFNYTPNQDKATASLLGDVPRGVMLDQPPIFLGGQGGLVGPCRLAFGTVVAAGCLIRKDELRPNRLIGTGRGNREINIVFKRGAYPNLKRIVRNNVTYIGNLIALRHWYRHVRAEFVSEDFPETLLKALIDKLDRAIDERISRLKKVYLERYVGGPVRTSQPPAGPTDDSWDRIDTLFRDEKNNDMETQLQENFLRSLSAISPHGAKRYIDTIRSLPLHTRDAGVRWLDRIVARVISGAEQLIPEIV